MLTCRNAGSIPTPLSALSHPSGPTHHSAICESKSSTTSYTSHVSSLQHVSLSSTSPAPLVRTGLRPLRLSSSTGLSPERNTISSAPRLNYAPRSPPSSNSPCALASDRHCSANSHSSSQTIVPLISSVCSDARGGLKKRGVAQIAVLFAVAIISSRGRSGSSGGIALCPVCRCRF